MTKNTKKAYKEKVRAKITQIDGALIFLKGKLIDIKADTRLKVEHKLNELFDRRKGIQKRIDDLKESGEDLLDDVRRGIDHALNDLGSAIERLRMQFR